MENKINNVGECCLGLRQTGRTTRTFLVFLFAILQLLVRECWRVKVKGIFSGFTLPSISYIFCSLYTYLSLYGEDEKEIEQIEIPRNGRVWITTSFPQTHIHSDALVWKLENLSILWVYGSSYFLFCVVILYVGIPENRWNEMEVGVFFCFFHLNWWCGSLSSFSCLWAFCLHFLFVLGLLAS